MWSRLRCSSCRQQRASTVVTTWNYILYSRLYNEGPAKLPDPFECYFLGRIKSFQMPKANRLTINPIAIIPTIGIIISFLLLYYMKSISRIQPKNKKCLLSIARKANKTISKTAIWTKNRTDPDLKIHAYCSKYSLKIADIALKINCSDHYI